MDDFNTSEVSPNKEIKKLRDYFDGKIVRKDLTKSIKEGANILVYVLEFLMEQLQTFTIIWTEKRLAWSAYGTVLPLMK